MATWFVIGISGVSCSGKTTLAKQISDNLRRSDNTRHLVSEVRTIHQDAYFHPIESPHHIWIPDLKHINREHLGALATDKLLFDIRAVLSNKGADASTTLPSRTLHVLIVEGHLIFNHPDINAYFDIRFCMDISFEECQRRRHRRVYPQPTPSGYFERFVWPLFRAHYDEFMGQLPQAPLVLNGAGDACEQVAMRAIWQHLEETDDKV